MVKKLKLNGGRFLKGSGNSKDQRIFEGSPSTSFEGAKMKRKREPKSVFDQLSKTMYRGSIPPGARLRPCLDKDAQSCPPDITSENWVVDNTKMMTAYNDALKSHNSLSGRSNHTAILKQFHVKNRGFGIKLRFCCRFKNCKFISQNYDLYEKTEKGEPTINLQAGVAMSKTDLTPKNLALLSTTLNLASPSRQTLQKTYSKALACTSELAEEAMAENRAKVITAVRLNDEFVEGEIPTVDVATDGQYSNRAYHCPTGKSDSVSVPVIEHVTGTGLLIQHSNLSHRDGTLDAKVHINSGETIAAKTNLEKTYLATKCPLNFGVVTVDGDTGVARALEAGRMSVGETRPLKRRGCSFHGFAAG